MVNTYVRYFNKAISSVSRHDLNFDKDKYVQQCQVLNGEYQRLKEQYKDNLFLYDFNGVSDIIGILTEYCNGRDKKYADFIKRQYYEAEEGSLQENLYACIKQGIERGSSPTADLFSKYFIDTVGNLRIDSGHIRTFMHALDNIAERGKYGWRKYFAYSYREMLTIMYAYLRAHEIYNEPFTRNIVCDEGKQRKSEFDGFRAYIRKGVISPNFNNTYSLTWTGCSQIMCDYVPSFCIPQGYRGYISTKTGVCLASTVAAVRDTDYVTAMKFVNESKQGLIYTDLSKKYEDSQITNLLTGDYAKMDGVCGKVIERWFYEGAGTNGVYDYYNQEVAKTVQAVTGKRIYEVLSELEENGISSDDCYIYWVKDDKFALAVRDNKNVTKILPNTHKYFKPTPQPNYVNILNKNYVDF